ncbi:MAG: carbonic anhydrase [Woronichinia naegeliana WA131]|jgi:carbonic anhydrase|uniref:carbonic anhydrase n=1 Tax=Woronichinia naegeliana WA131 TaxID=2824559 RepID=A0A977KZ44_9CYAN|nr:MAG: carbonic anhydrase [Woronichinia naegeliana WA131]
MATVLGSNLINAPVANAQNKDITPDEALKKLVEGNDRFVNQKRTNRNQTKERLVEVAKGQEPFAAILGCADSRVPGEIVFDQGLGDLFVCRVAGNIATPEDVGSLEFGTLVLGAKVLVVMGHTSCGAVKAAIQGGELPGSIGSLIKSIDIGSVAPKSEVPGDVDKAAQANVNHQVETLKKSPILSDLIAKDKLKIVGAYYDLDTGKVAILS